LGNYDSVVAAMRAKDSVALRASLTSGAQVPVPVLCELLMEQWHDVHEDIVFELGLIGDATAVDTIHRAASIPFESLVKWGNLSEFQRKCTYALARIVSEESRQALELLAKSHDPQLREYAQEGLAHWPLPYRKR
jgi:hypothetical protein